MIDLDAERDRLLTFARGSRHPDGGFAWLRNDGTPDLERPRELWINARMTHVFAQAGDEELTAHGLAALRGDFRDDEHGGWFSQAGVPGDKSCYDHVFVVLAAASAGDRELLGAGAGRCSSTRFWEESAGALADTCSRDWTSVEPYRGREREHARRRGAGRGGRSRARERGSPERFVGGAAGDRALRRRLAAAAALQPRRPRAPLPALRRDAGPRVRVGAAGVRPRLRARGADAVRRRAHRRLGRRRASSTRSTGTGGRSSATT